MTDTATTKETTELPHGQADMNAELDAMASIGRILAALQTEDAKVRVLNWAASRFQVGLAPERDGGIEPHKPRVSQQPEFETLPDLINATNAETENNRALVAAYWIQEHGSTGDFAAQAVNSQLTQMGIPLSNVTRSFDRLMERSPKLVIQLQKSGKSKQARKTYKVTTAGVGAVLAMLAKAPTT